MTYSIWNKLRKCGFSAKSTTEGQTKIIFDMKKNQRDKI